VPRARRRAGQALRIAGDDVLTVNEVLDLFSNVTDRSPLRVPLPSLLARSAPASPPRARPRNARQRGHHPDAHRGQRHPATASANDLVERLGFRPEPIRTRLVELADDMPEQTPEDGVGELQRRRFRVDILDSRWTPPR
jgi:hypothetical protein